MNKTDAVGDLDKAMMQILTLEDLIDEMQLSEKEKEALHIQLISIYYNVENALDKLEYGTNKD